MVYGKKTPSCDPVSGFSFPFWSKFPSFSRWQEVLRFSSNLENQSLIPVPYKPWKLKRYQHINLKLTYQPSASVGVHVAIHLKWVAIDFWKDVVYTTAHAIGIATQLSNVMAISWNLEGTTWLCLQKS